MVLVGWSPRVLSQSLGVARADHLRRPFLCFGRYLTPVLALHTELPTLQAGESYSETISSWCLLWAQAKPVCTGTSKLGWTLSHWALFSPCLCPYLWFTLALLHPSVLSSYNKLIAS